MTRSALRNEVTEFTAALGIQGWSSLDPLLLGALALGAPVLLVGEHGTAKSLVVERVATSLGSCFRHYNASLLNYDDLVGIPLPDEHGGLRFVGTAGAVWGAEFVFFDEINRCRPDLQNKMFPIVHERRVAGVDLPELEHRWAAMNPPMSADDTLGGYLGTEPLDAALADRFWYVIGVPCWSDLTASERLGLVAGDLSGEPASGARLDVPDLVTRTRGELDAVRAQHGDLVTRYVVILVNLLCGAGIAVSPRRASILARTVLATAAAAQVLERPMSMSDIAELVVRNGLPHWSEPEPPSMAQVVAAHVQAFEVASQEADELKGRLLAESDLLQRVLLGLELGADAVTLAQLSTMALAEQPSTAHQLGLAVVFSRALAEQSLTPAAWSGISDLAVRVLSPREVVSQQAPGRALDAWRNASAWLATHPPSTPIEKLEVALVTACGPELLADVKLPTLLADFRSMCAMFGVTE